MEKCIEITVTGDPCPNDATVGEYCIIHSPGWDNFKANVVVLYTVYGYATAALGIIGTLGPIVGLPKIFNVTGNELVDGVFVAPTGMCRRQRIEHGRLRLV